MARTRERDYYTIPEAAERLGVSPSTVWRWIKVGTLPAYRIGARTIRIRKEDLGQATQPATPPAADKRTYSLSEGVHFELPDAEELARRRALFEEVLANRKGRVIAPLTTADLVRMARDEEYEAYGRW